MHFAYSHNQDVLDRRHFEPSQPEFCGDKISKFSGSGTVFVEAVKSNIQAL